MDIELPADCGNAPRMIIVGDFVTSWASGDTDAVSGWLSDDVSWTIVGADTYTGPDSARQAAPRIQVERLVVQSIVTHGRLASCDGYLQAGPTRIAFSHAIRFTGASKSAKIAELRTYCIASQQQDEGVVYVPASAFPDPHTYTDLGNFTVEDETFAVRRRDDDGSAHYDWTSGPNDDYGFSVFCGPGPLSRERHIAAIRDFLSGIDPATGYLSDP